MPALDAALAAAALADVNVELSMDRPPRNLDLILLLHVGFVDGSTAIGAGVGQRGLVGLGSDLGVGRWALVP